MKEPKRVLAKVSKSELDRIIQLRADLSTYFALTKNQFATKSEHEIFARETNDLQNELQKNLDDLFHKYKIPISAKEIALISYETGEIYISI